MRIRLRSLPPLSPLKVWFEIPPTITVEYSTIALLKHEICQRLLSSTETIHANQIILELDEFELLDSSTVSVIRENDLLVVKYKPNSAIGKKRKRDSVTEGRHSLVLRKVPQSTATPSSSSGSSTSSSSEESSSSDSDDSSSTASSSTTSSSSSDSSTSTASTPVRIRPPDLRNTINHSGSPTAPVHGQPSKGYSIPPGQGKITTHQRNLRRRKKRLAEKEKEQNSAPPADTIPTQRQGLVLPVATTSVIDETTLRESMLRTTKNDNKKKGFKQGMQSTTAKHQLFREDIAQLSPLSKGAPNGTQRVIPPSERTDLPKNILVTSVDVEAGKWSTTGWQGKIDGKPSGNKSTADGSKNQDAHFVPTQRNTDSEPIVPGWDWERVDSSWESYPFLTSRGSITKGNVLLWRDLALNAATYLPEIMVHAGEVLEVTNEEEVKMRPIPRFSEDEEAEMEQEAEDERDVVVRNVKTLKDYRLFV